LVNPFKMAMTLVGALVVGLQAFSSWAAAQPGSVNLPWWVFAGVTVATAMLVLIQAQMPGWTESGEAHRAIKEVAYKRALIAANQASFAATNPEERPGDAA
jgi:hypothetical protein